jgi:hypothetical protein
MPQVRQRGHLAVNAPSLGMPAGVGANEPFSLPSLLPPIFRFQKPRYQLKDSGIRFFPLMLKCARKDCDQTAGSIHRTHPPQSITVVLVLNRFRGA